MKVGPKRYLWKRMAVSPVTIAVLALVVLFLGNATWNVYRGYRIAHEKEMMAKDNLEAMVARAEVLEEDIARLTSKKGKEEEIRTRFGYGREGEHMIVIVDEKESEDNSSENDAWYTRFWYWIMRK
jgi:cell division protein FtsB